MDTLHTTRDANGADLAATITVATEFCGISRFPTSSDPAELDAFSLTDADCAVGGLSFPHEIGHNLCANHDPENAGGNPCGPDSFGHFSKEAGLRTVMSYDERFIDCPGCVRIPYFSNPNVTVDGWTTGILGERDNARVVGVHAPGVAAYRSPSTGPGPCEVDYMITGTWPGNVQVDLVVENTTVLPVNGWTAQWTFTGDENVYNSWGVTVSQVGAQATAAGDGWGVMIPPGGTITVGFQATVTGTPTVPSPITCNA